MILLVLKKTFLFSTRKMQLSTKSAASVTKKGTDASLSWKTKLISRLQEAMSRWFGGILTSAAKLRLKQLHRRRQQS